MKKEETIEELIPENNSVEKKDSTKKKNKKGLIIVLVVIALIILIAGIFTAYINNPKKIIATAIEKVSSDLKEVIDVDSKNKVGENFTLKENVKFNIESDYLEALTTYDTSYQPYINMIKNINKLDTDISITQNKSDKKLFATINSKLNNDELINAKYLVTNNTEYYFIKDFLRTYINNGNNNYFEALNESTTSTENIKYIYDFCIKSLKSNLKNSYFETKTEETTINGTNEKLKKTSLKINDKIAKELATNILNDLKKDKKATNILSGIDTNFKKTKIDKNASLFSSDQKLYFSVYTDKITSKAKKYQITYKDSNSNYDITYENGKDKTILNVLYNNNVIVIATITENNNTKTISISDSSNKEIATIKIFKNKDDYNVTLDANIADQMSINMKFNKTTTEVEKNKKYKTDAVLSGNITSNNTTLGKIEISTKSEITSDATINEDTSNSILSSSITQSQKEQLQTQFTNIFPKLMS